MTISRRGMMRGCAAASVFATAGLGTMAQAARPGAAPRPLSMRADGTYETVPLAKDAITLGVVQSRVVP
ncbi:MAG TPA: hypothetical protein PK680_05030, partial [Novosphingobium sp.]|nr:hypothetical protein [Novosphingobium sp.]